MDLFEIVFGRGLLEGIGGTIRFGIDKFMSIFTRKNVKPFSTYFKDGKGDVFTNGVGNHIIGIIFFGIIIFILILAISPAG